MNTVSCYARLVLAAGAGLFVVPTVLKKLGPSDYGMLSVIAGSMSSILFVNGALTSGAQRYIAFALGEGRRDEVHQWFTASLLIHVFFALGVLVLADLGSHWALHSFLKLPPERLSTSVWIYWAAVFVAICNMISTPYIALLMAKEEIAILSIVATGSSLFLVIGAFVLRTLPGDPLMWYTGIYAVSDGLFLIGPIVLCLAYHAESRVTWERPRWRALKGLLGFSSWNLIGGLAVQIRYQGPGILLNRFIGTTANAANAVAMEINGFASGLSTGLIRATSPAIVKSEATGDRAEMLLLANLSNKYGFVLLWVLIAPLLFEMNFLLSRWLHQVPPHTTVFSIALLTALLLDMLCAGFMAAIQAEGRIALYQSVIGVLLCISVPTGYLFLRWHLDPSSVLWAATGGSVLASLGRLIFVCKRTGFSGWAWLRGVLYPCFIIATVCFWALVITHVSTAAGVTRVFLDYLINILLAGTMTIAFASSEQEQHLLRCWTSALHNRVSLASIRMRACALRRQ